MDVRNRVNDTVKRSSPTQVPIQWSTTKFQKCAGRAPMAIKTMEPLGNSGVGTGELGLNDTSFITKSTSRNTME